MKNLSMLVWLTQLGLSVVSPLLGFILLAIWLHNGCGWGEWVIWVGVILGVYCAVMGLVDTLRSMEKHAKRNLDQDTQPPLSFNDHE